MEVRVCFLAALFIFSTFTVSTRSASCCLKYIKRELPCQLISGYTYQSMGRFCDINAVILHLPRRFLCADPTSNWTQRVMRCVDERRKKKNFEKSTNITRATAA